MARAASELRLWLACGVIVLGGAGCAASLRPVVLAEPEPGPRAGERTRVAVGQPMASGPAIEQGCHGYVAVMDYLTPSAGAREPAWIVRGQQYSACYEDPADPDALFLTDAHPVRSGVWLRIRRAGFLRDKDGWWSYLSTEGPEDYRTIHLFQGAWNRSKWTLERLMAPAVAEITYEGREGDEVRLSYRVGAPAAGVPFELRAEETYDLSLTDVISSWRHSFRILAADESSISFVATERPRANVRAAGDS